jgi:hypothetical protein
MSTPNAAKPTFNWKLQLMPRALKANHNVHSDVESIKLLAALSLLGTTLLWSLHV